MKHRATLTVLFRFSAVMSPLVSATVAPTIVGARAVALVDPARNLQKSREAIAADNQTYNAFIGSVPDAEQAIANGLNIGSTFPLAGVTVAVKANIDLASFPATAGAKAPGRTYASQDAEVIVRLKEAGALVVGVTNMDTWARGTTSVSELDGATGNAWDATRSPLGSSGGSAVAVARGMADVALGTDTCGSIRYPASANGIFGLRPTHGAVSMLGVVPLSPTQDVVGPIAASVDDLRRVFAVIKRTASSAPTDTVSMRVPSKRIGVLRAYGPLNQALLESLRGFELVDVSLPNQAANVISDEFGVARSMWRASPDWFERFTANPPTSRGYRTRLSQQRALRERLIALLHNRDLDAVVYPTSTSLPGKRGAKQRTGNCWISANSGLPALAVPGFVTNGFPTIGVDLLGRPSDEDGLLAIAEAMRPGKVPLASEQPG